jgi:hypothetical protein
MLVATGILKSTVTTNYQTKATMGARTFQTTRLVQQSTSFISRVQVLAKAEKKLFLYGSLVIDIIV